MRIQRPTLEVERREIDATTRVATDFEAPVVPGASGVRVLVVEDDHDMRVALREMFELHGMSVDTAMDGVDASAHGLRVPYDVVVSDIRLPGMSGIALSRSLQGRSRPPRVILITAYPEWKVVQEAYEAGAVEVVRKPFDLGKLAKRVVQAARDRANEL